MPQGEPLERFELRRVLHEHRAVRHREGLVKAEDGPVAERSKRLSLHVAEQREGAILDEQHAPTAAQVRQRWHRLRPSDVVDHVKQVRIERQAHRFDPGWIHSHVGTDGAEMDGGACGAESR